MLCYIYSILVKICYYRAYDFSVNTFVSCFWHEHHKAWVRQISGWTCAPFHGGYWHENCGAYVQAQIQMDTSKHMFVATVEFQQHPPSPPQPRLPSFSTYTFSVTATCENACSGVWVFGAFFIIAKNWWPRSRLCRLRAKRGEIGSLS